MKRPLGLVYGACRWAGLSIATFAAASLLGGCASSAATPTVTPTATPTGTPAATPTSVATATMTPTATPTSVATATIVPKAVTYGPVAVIAGVENCNMDAIFGTTSGEGTTVQHSRNGTAKCTDTTNDPRVNGTYTATWNMDYWGTPDDRNGALVQWGTARLVAAGGAWEGRATGVYSTDRGDTIVTWWTGTGAYAGLAYFELATGTGPWTIQGQIFPGSPPKP